MSKYALEVLFHSKVRVRLLRFLFRNEDMPFNLKDITNRVQEPKEKVFEEIEKLVAIGLIKIHR